MDELTNCMKIFEKKKTINFQFIKYFNDSIEKFETNDLPNQRFHHLGL